MTIELWLAVFASLGLILMALGIHSALRRSRERKYREKLRKLELVLLPRESIKAVCPQKKGRWILTSRRLLFETPQGFTAVALKSIQKAQGLNEKGNRTTSVPQMVCLTVKAEQEYTIQNSCEEFDEFAKLLLKRTQKKKAKK